jgi:hypothetical protein
MPLAWTSAAVNLRSYFARSFGGIEGIRTGCCSPSSEGTEFVGITSTKQSNASMLNPGAKGFNSVQNHVALPATASAEQVFVKGSHYTVHTDCGVSSSNHFPRRHAFVKTVRSLLMVDLECLKYIFSAHFA